MAGRRSARDVLRQAIAGVAPRSAYWVDIAWVAAINALAQGIGVLCMPILTRLYAPADFAALNIFTNCVAFASVVLSMRYEYMVQLAREERDAFAVLHLVGMLALAGCVVSMPLIWLYRDTLAGWLGSAALANSLVFVPLSGALISVSLALQHLSQRRQQFKRSSSSDIVNKLGYVGTAFVGHWLVAGPAGLLAASGAGALGKIAWLLRAGPAPAAVPQAAGAAPPGSLARIDGAAVRRTVGTYHRLSTSLVFSHLMLTLTGLIPSVFIARAYGSFVLGQFALVISTIFLPASLLGAAIGQVYYQRAAARWSEGQDFSALWLITARKLLRIGAPIYLVVALLSPWAYPLIFGAEWQLAGQFAPYLAVSAFFSFLSGPLDRSCLIVGAWRYIPLWHLSRTLTTAAVVGLAWLGQWSPQAFLLALTVQTTALYLVDLYAERRFARLTPGRGE
jgi:O-antigen/teichoic acid export membrane protein